MSAAGPTRELIPPEMDQHRVAWLTTSNDRSGATSTKIRFATDGGKVYALIPRDSTALKQLQQQAQVRISLGKGNARLKGPEAIGSAYPASAGDVSWARHLLTRKYWRLRIPFWWQWQAVVIEITIS